MEISDEYQDMGNPGGGVAMANIPLGHHRQQSPDSPMSHQEEDLSDPDLQDEESGEELPQQPLQANNHPSSDNNTSGQATTPTPLTHLNSLMTTHHPHFLSKLKMEPNDMDILSNKSGLEALQAAMGGGGFNLPFSFPPPSAFLTPQHNSHNNHQQIGGGVGGGGGGGGGGPGGNALTSSASSHSSESSQGSARNSSDVRDSGGQNSQNNAANSHQQQTSWSFEEQFKQLYEINDDPKRKEFLDDLFSFMQKRGKRRRTGTRPARCGAAPAAWTAGRTGIPEGKPPSRLPHETPPREGSLPITPTTTPSSPALTRPPPRPHPPPNHPLPDPAANPSCTP